MTNFLGEEYKFDMHDELYLQTEDIISFPLTTALIGNPNLAIFGFSPPHPPFNYLALKKKKKKNTLH